MIAGVTATITGSNDSINEMGTSDTVTSAGSNDLVNVVSTGGTVNLSNNAGDIVDFSAGSQGTVTGAGNTIGFLGAATVAASGANTTFAVGGGAGQDTIAGFQAGSDVIQFNAALFANYAAVMADTAQVGANTVIQINANNSVTLDNLTASTLTASNFHFS
jgi:hypothetical protein